MVRARKEASSRLSSAIEAMSASDRIAVVLMLVNSPSAPIHRCELLVAHLRNSSSLPVDVHLATDVTRTDTPADWTQHLVGAAAPEWVQLHAAFEPLTGPSGFVYMWKPLLHRVLPISLRKAIVLDVDIFILRLDLADLWREFDALERSPKAAIGLAWEQQPSYDPNGPSPFRTFASGWGFNGGVQLMHLERMRDGGLWERADARVPRVHAAVGSVERATKACTPPCTSACQASFTYCHAVGTASWRISSSATTRRSFSDTTRAAARERTRASS